MAFGAHEKFAKRVPEPPSDPEEFDDWLEEEKKRATALFEYHMELYDSVPENLLPSPGRERRTSLRRAFYWLRDCTIEEFEALGQAIDRGDSETKIF